MEFPCRERGLLPPSGLITRLEREVERGRLEDALYSTGEDACWDGMAGVERRGALALAKYGCGLWVCTADAKGVKSRKTAKHTSLQPVPPAMLPARPTTLLHLILFHIHHFLSKLFCKLQRSLIQLQQSPISKRGRWKWKTNTNSVPEISHTCLLIEHGLCTLSLSKLFPPIVYIATLQLNRRASSPASQSTLSKYLAKYPDIRGNMRPDSRVSKDQQ